MLRGRLSGRTTGSSSRPGRQVSAAAPCAPPFRRTCCSSDVPTEKAGDLVRELGTIGLHVEGSPFWRGAVACTGTEFCKLAITETKGFTRWLVDELEERVPQFDQQLRLHVTGCPNGCGQHWIADIGIEGKKIKHEGKLRMPIISASAGRSGNTRYRAPRGLSRACHTGARSDRATAAAISGRAELEENLRHGSHATPTTNCGLHGRRSSRIGRARSTRGPRAPCRS